MATNETTTHVFEQAGLGQAPFRFAGFQDTAAGAGGQGRMKWNVIYLWRGERHHGGQHDSEDEASKECDKFRADKWQAWIESVR